MKKSEPVLLGIETGGTKTIALAATSGLRPLERFEFGPANLRLVSDQELAGLFREVKRKIPAPDGIGIGLSGVRTEGDTARVTNLLNKVWPNVPSRVTHDLELIIHAA